MYCPFCQAQDTKVVDSRLVDEGTQVRRRRECIECEERFTSYELAELSMPEVIKVGGVRQPFEKSKLKAGMLKALEKRPVSLDKLETTLTTIMRQLRGMGEREIHSKLLGEFVMEALLHLDKVAYIRFASVYRDFENLEAFKEEIKRLRLSDQHDT